jgi:DnaK suppressor protein
MTSEEKKELKIALLDKKKELETLIEELKVITKPQSLDSAIGRISRMDYINNKSVNEATLKKSQRDHNSVVKWLSIFNTDRFGKCTFCGKEINIKRLLYMPSSNRCINCADK